MAISNSPPKVNPDSTADGRSESPDVPANAAQQEAATTDEISLAIDSLMLKVDADRHAYVMKRMEENRIKVAEITNNKHKLSIERTNNINGDKMDNLLTRRMKEASEMLSRVNISSGSSSGSPQEAEHASVILLGAGIPVKNSVRPILLPEVEKLPRYTTWNFMDRNQRSLGPINNQEDKKEFSDSEDNIIRMAIEELGSSDTVFDVLAQRLSRKPCEVKARHEALVSKDAIESSKPGGETDSDMSSLLDKHLEEAQSSFDYLFCRRCLIFGCKLHGPGQELVFPSEKLTCDDMEEEEEETVPCGPDCYLQVQVPEVMKEDESKKATDFECWRTLEKDLFEKGLEIFGKNSCLIARNLLGGLKTCTEVFHVLNKLS